LGQEVLLLRWCSVIYVSRCKHKVQQFSLLVAYQWSLKPKNQPIEHFPLGDNNASGICNRKHKPEWESA
jgi:hypothetical protein